MAKKEPENKNEPPVTDNAPPSGPVGAPPTGPATVRMVRPEGNPNTADVHPDEVANYQAGGWSVE